MSDELGFEEVLEVGVPFTTDEEKQASAHEDLTHHTDPRTGKKLPIFTVGPECVLAEDCVRSDGFFLFDPEGSFNEKGEPRAIAVRQPRTEGEVEVCREHAKACPVSCIKEVDPA
ncbi:hypothetical protein KW797_02485 [Candidatus Parcubacteria bacterium]|nr:hypothetical protein [Candidatus Parcubacteria bacterium]